MKKQKQKNNYIYKKWYSKHVWNELQSHRIRGLHCIAGREKILREREMKEQVFCFNYEVMKTAVFHRSEIWIEGTLVLLYGGVYMH